MPHRPPALTDVWLSRLAVEDNPRFGRIAQGDDLNYVVRTQIEIDFEEEVLVHLQMEIAWERAPGEAGPAIDGPFEIALTVTGEFDVMDASPAREVLERWLTANTTHLLWPYARSYISAATAATRHMPLTLFTITAPTSRAFEQETGEHATADPGG